MKQHQYRITVEHLTDEQGNAVQAAPLQFNAPNHDNIFQIIEKIQQRDGFTPEMAQRFAVGLKLMGEVMLENRKQPLFEQLRPHFLEMMKIIKGKA
ncbi:uncharacterized protein DUF3861 [Cricetibacter osteomyelitidis]|uniref:Uncharacterized protein DUF3861 n=1 Tax=Cricetibacter osteomyelitidis TaxID=1521931 RepID=A0A4R2SMM2_9PAST|nr:DUF3861 domain-containing protein [Cricetibacter osteomyelitidis]TCP91289.1 uncharacterized protein DUF3861 [Cricetibacter osteomyelitidis]